MYVYFFSSTNKKKMWEWWSFGSVTFDRFAKSIIEKDHFYLEKTLIYFKTLNLKRKFFHLKSECNSYSCYSPHHTLFKRYNGIPSLVLCCYYCYCCYFSSSLLSSSSSLCVFFFFSCTLLLLFRQILKVTSGKWETFCMFYATSISLQEKVQENFIFGIYDAFSCCLWYKVAVCNNGGKKSLNKEIKYKIRYNDAILEQRSWKKCSFYVLSFVHESVNCKSI